MTSPNGSYLVSKSFALQIPDYWYLFLWSHYKLYIIGHILSGSSKMKLYHKKQVIYQKILEGYSNKLLS